MRHLHNTCYVCITELLNVRERSIAIIVLVTLDICFILEHDTIFIAQIVPIWSIGIVRATYMVDITTQHDHHLFVHLLASDGMTTNKVILVAVYTLHLDGLAVEVIVTTSQTKLIILSLGVADLNLAEAHICRSGLHDATLLIFEIHDQSITIWSLRIPLIRILHCNLHSGSRCSKRSRKLYRSGSDCTIDSPVNIAIKIVTEELSLQCITLSNLRGKVTNINIDFSNAILILGIEIGSYSQITQLYRIGSSKRYCTEDTRQAEHILRLKERSIRATINLYCHNILALDKILRDVERSEVTRVLRETYVVTVDPEIEE